MDRYDDVERELGRVVDRLTSMPLAKAEAATADVEAAAELLVAHLREVDRDVPSDAAVPQLGPQGLGALIAVLGGDWLAGARATGDPDPEPVTAILVSLRRSLP